MYQINFNNQCMLEINKLETEAQMALIEAISAITPERLTTDSHIGRFNRKGTVFYRFPFQDFRVYFEIQAETLLCHYILHKHTMDDFRFRMKLPISEENNVEEDQKFWSYLESLKK